MDKSDSNDNLLKPVAYVSSKTENSKTDIQSDKTKVNKEVPPNSNGVLSPKKSGPGFYANPANRSSMSVSASNSMSENGKAKEKETSKLDKEEDSQPEVKVKPEVMITIDESNDGAKSDQQDPNADTASVSSTSSRNDGHEKSERIVNMCLRGDWIYLDQQLRNMRRGHHCLTKKEPVRIPV